MQALKNDESIKFEFCYSDNTFIEEIKDFFSALLKIINFIDDNKKNDTT